MKRLRVDAMKKQRSIKRADRTSEPVPGVTKNLRFGGGAGIGCGKNLRVVRQRP